MGRKTKNDIEGLDKIDKFDILTNFKHYKLPLPEFFVQDVHRPMLRLGDKPLFDSIVCDPPYGVRARTHKVGIPEKKQAIYEERKAMGKDIISPEEYDEKDNFHASMKEQYS